MRHLLLRHSVFSALPRHGSRRASAGVAAMPDGVTTVVAALSAS
jgi:hypothetical protein